MEPSTIHNILKQYWGYDTFRPLQEDIINSVLDGKDTLALLPTGGGKSLCFQVPGMAMEGLTVIISPLIALMKDQVENLQKRDIPAIALYSGLSFREIDLELNNCIFGKYKFLYVSPERLTAELFRERIAQMPVKLIAVDEAHCISQWGYDFRPEYLRIAELRPFFPKVPVIALTATATPQVVQDIQDKLEFKQPNLYSKSFTRENLQYLVLNEENKWNRLLNIVHKTPGSGVVYARSRFLTQKVAAFLQQNRESADYYHAGLSPAQRNEKQESWTRGSIRVIVATNAFGMGIDKPDVRFVVHLDIPETLEAYYQEAGRAGRDEKKAYCVLLYTDADGHDALEKMQQQNIDAKEARRILDMLHTFYNIAMGGGQGMSYDFDVQSFATRFGLHNMEVYNALRVLEQQGIVALSDAVFIPSKIKFTVDNYTLYEYQIKYPVMSDFVKLILRSYGGAFEQYVSISETELGRRAGISAAEAAKGLEKLHQNEIIDYQPKKDKPQLTFNFHRGNELIDSAAINSRNKIAQEKLEAVIHYATQTETCRQRLLSAYFGEENAQNCGHCDVCINLRKKVSQPKEFEYYRTKIEEVLKQGPAEITDLIQSMNLQDESLLTDTLRRMTESQLVMIKEGTVYWNGKRK